MRDAIQTRSSAIAVGTARVDDQCAFGKWLYGETLHRELKQSAHYQKCVELHRRFHLAAGDVLSLALAGRKEEAARAMEPGSEFAQISGALASALTAWDTRAAS